ncbi:MAG: hypothetical protein JWN33_655 [Candidatus Saccharibacteria bacterium]|nr:hypothetical protein [Candidatus Saccharibacteria bacterium]
MELSDEQFDALITRAMNELPQEYIKGLDNVAIVMADEPDEHQRASTHVRENGLLLGLYQGIPLTHRGGGYNLVLPDKITLFKHALLQISYNPESLFENIKRTLWHEIAHYYGLDHARMDFLESKHRGRTE